MVDEQSKVDAKYPALLFKQHLTAYVEKIYGMIRDTVKKNIAPFLNLCIQVSILCTDERQNHKMNFILIYVSLTGTEICEGEIDKRII